MMELSFSINYLLCLEIGCHKARSWQPILRNTADPARIPWGIRAPMAVYLAGSRRKSTTSASSSFSSSAPATSSKVTFLPSGTPSTVRALPKFAMGLLLFIRPIRKPHTNSRISPTITRGRIKS